MSPPPSPPTTDATRLVGLPPVLGRRPRILVLGSMPGAESLRLQQYYGHPRNDFWPIMEDVFGIRRQLPYAARTAALEQAGVALWDVLATCTRKGSLDASIQRESMQANDVPGVLAAHPSLRSVVFNGALAEKIFLAQVPVATGAAHPLMLRRLPSTSPANASVRYDQKLVAWREALTWTPDAS